VSFLWDGHDVLVLSVWGKSSSGEEVCLGNTAVSLFKLTSGSVAEELVDLKPSWVDDKQPVDDNGCLLLQLTYTEDDNIVDEAVY
jgi:hypothetical protein